MPEQLHAFEELSTREGFNRSLKHFKFISQVIGEFERRRNLADTLSECLADKTIEVTSDQEAEVEARIPSAMTYLAAAELQL